MKKILSAALAGALVLSLAVPALAAGSNVYVVNGKTLNTSSLPQADGIPMRAFVEADGGAAEWYAEDNMSLFYIDGASMSVDFASGKAEVGSESFSGAFAVAGVTYAPVEAVEAMEGVSVTVSGNTYTITTPTADPLNQLAKDIIAQTGMGNGMKASSADLANYYGISADLFESVVAYLPMMINADTIIVGKVNSGKMNDAKEALEARKAATIQNFENYLPAPLEMAENGKIVSNGDYVMLIISPDNTTATSLFNTFVKNQ